MNYKERLKRFRQAENTDKEHDWYVADIEELLEAIAIHVKRAYEFGYEQRIVDEGLMDRERKREVLPLSARAILYTKDQGWMQ